VVLEYDDVLERTEILEKLDLTADYIENVIDLLVLLAKKHSIYYRLRPNLPDENDNLFVERAFTSKWVKKVVTLRIPLELKARLEHEAKHQGVSLNNLANYFLTTQLSQVKAISMIDERISKKIFLKLKS